MRYLVITALGLVLLLAAVVASLPYMLGGEFITAQLQQAVARHTGRTLTLLKPPSVALFPEASVTVDGATLSNPQGMFDGTTVSMERIEARVSVWQFFTRGTEVREITLVRPRVTLAIDGEGRANWALPDAASTPGANAGGGGTSPAVASVASVRIVDGSLSFSDERSGTGFSAASINARIDLPLNGKPFKADGSLRWNNELVNLKLFVLDPARLAAAGSPVELALQARLLEAAISGRARLAGGLDLAGKADLSSPDLRKLAGWGGWETADGPGLKDVSVNGALAISDGRVSLEDAKLNMDGASANGLVRVITGGSRPKVEASLGVNRLDLNTYAPPPQGAGQAGTDQAADGWSDAPVSLAGLAMADATLRLRVGEVVYRKLSFKDASIDATLDNGKLTATLNELGLYGTKATGRMEIDGSQNLPRLAGTLNATGVDAQALFTDLAGITAISGAADVALELGATGSSQREMVSTLAGTAQIELRNGAVEGIDITAMTGAVQGSILDGWSASSGNGSTRLDELTAAFAVRDGIAATDALLARGPGFEVTGAGQADLLRRRLDFKVAPKAQLAAGEEMMALPVPVIISGPWAAPKIYPDVEGILDDPQSAFDTLGKLGVNVEAAGQALRGEAEKLLGRDGARQAEDLLNNLLKQQD
ncbi:MAG: AsmA family protein [Anderseniella sp.]|jgi:AsmA protein|nr:AsmA family protein [Anderseniella sp.]